MIIDRGGTTGIPQGKIQWVDGMKRSFVVCGRPFKFLSLRCGLDFNS
jgi:hypothetical protein